MKKIGIIVALNKEAARFIEKERLTERPALADKKIFAGILGDKEIILAVSGIGKVSAALCAQAVIDAYSPDVLINFGTVGGFGNKVSAKNYYSVEKCCQYDFDLSDLDDVSVGYIQDYDTVFFNVNACDFLEKRALATSDKFTCKENDVKTVDSLGCSLCDMEGAAIAQVCASNAIPLYIVKGVTDVFGSGTNASQFNENLKAVSDGFPDVILKLLNEL